MITVTTLRWPFLEGQSAGKNVNTIEDTGNPMNDVIGRTRVSDNY